MTKMKLCGLSRPIDILWANEIKPDYIGFVFYPKSKRYVNKEQAKALRLQLDLGISAVGVFIDESVEFVADLLKHGIIDIAQLHGSEGEDYIRELRAKSKAPIIKAFKITSKSDLELAMASTADYILLDSGTGSGEVFDWSLLKDFDRPYFLAGGLNLGNVTDSIRALHPYAVDVSSGIETGAYKDKMKMAAFAALVRKEQ